MNSFQELSLPPALHRALVTMNFTVPTPIQAQAIPVALTGRDLIGCAQTGTGKTAAFGLPIVERLLKTPGRTALILAPTRELAAQIASVMKALTLHCPQLRSALLIGGASMFAQTKALRSRPAIVIGTPGRVNDHLGRRTLDLSKTEILVLDEADRMLDMGFAPQIQAIMKFVNSDRQTLLFSATLPPEIVALTGRILKNPARVSVQPRVAPGMSGVTAPSITQKTLETTHQKKNDQLLDELNARKGSVLIFARTQSRTERLTRTLAEYGHPVSQLHGGRTQGQRNSSLAGFRDGRFRILVATDIAARGIDVPHIAHVINYDLPQKPEDYVHRIGRTGRAGATGEALSFLTPEDRGAWRDIQRLVQRR